VLTIDLAQPLGPLRLNETHELIAMAGANETHELSGPLLKEGDRGIAWYKRYFVLNRHTSGVGVLHCYTNKSAWEEPGVMPVASLNLAGATVSSTKGDRPGKVVFRINLPPPSNSQKRRKLVLGLPEEASEALEMNAPPLSEWVEALGRCGCTSERADGAMVPSSGRLLTAASSFAIKETPRGGPPPKEYTRLAEIGDDGDDNETGGEKGGGGEEGSGAGSDKVLDEEAPLSRSGPMPTTDAGPAARGAADPPGPSWLRRIVYTLVALLTLWAAAFVVLDAAPGEVPGEAAFMEGTRAVPGAVGGAASGGVSWVEAEARELDRMQRGFDQGWADGENAGRI